MNVNGTSSSSNTSNSAPAAATNQLTGNDFMILLTAQLKAQDPTQPMDPTQFVGQLVQFNSLQQLIDINQTLTQMSGGSQTSSTTSQNSNASAQSATATQQSASAAPQSAAQVIARSLRGLI